MLILKKVVKWTLPPAGSFKVNTDAAILADHQLVGVGLIIRDSNGKVSTSFAQKFTVCFSPAMAEAVAILQGLQFVILMVLSLLRWKVSRINSGSGQAWS
ncbi:hypothetical protein Ddye_025764 [Dipteronia dyeriana]|uniref:RNase H type-1 domain-containing protein n=1 Tax=Dipteronia dyeriana TaxID=168575 RepID=A0AAD9TLT5_9ROSI|nr:hypothetical protein Ddye_025764 [Dipteronia dyeriana]